MALQLPDFQRINFDEANPYLVGLLKGQQFGQSALSFPSELQKQRVQAQYAEPMAAQDLQKAILFNKFYAPDKQSEIGLRNAQAGSANANARQTNYLTDNPALYAGGDAAQMFALQDAIRKNPSLGGGANPIDLWRQKIQSDINYKNMGGSRGSVDQKDLVALTNQIRNDNPRNPNETAEAYDQRINQLTNAYGSGETQLSDGSPLPPLSYKAQSLINNINNRNIPAAARNQLINANTLVSDLNSFDIDAVKQFAGLKGKAQLAYAKSQMLTNPNDPSIDPMARRYFSAMNQAIINMDSMRKAFGTSIVPDYVYQTIGRLTNPNDSIWNDPKQVEQSFNDVRKTIQKNRDLLSKQYKRGISAGEETTNSSNKPVERWGRDNNGRPVRINE